jgi:hypothetical protein
MKIYAYYHHVKKTIIIIILFLMIIGIVFSQSANQPRLPTPPTPPAAPENNNSSLFPRFPGFPNFPNRDSQENGGVREVEKYNLTVSEAFPNGNTGNNVANTINDAEYVLYSNRTIEIKLSFNSGSEYIYHLRNPGSKIEIRTGVFRETFETLVQVDKKFLLEQCLSELTYDNSSITSLVLIGNNRVIVVLNLSKKT